MHRFERERFQNKHVERALHEIRGNALDGERRPRRNIGCGDRVGDGYGGHSRLARKLVDNRSVKRADRRCGGVLTQRKIETRNSSKGGTETGIAFMRLLYTWRE